MLLYNPNSYYSMGLFLWRILLYLFKCIFSGGGVVKKLKKHILLLIPEGNLWEIVRDAHLGFGWTMGGNTNASNAKYIFEGKK